MILTVLKHIGFLLFAPLVVGSIVLSPLVVRELSDMVEAQKKPKLVPLYDDVETVENLAANITYKAVKFGEQNAEGENQ